MSRCAILNGELRFYTQSHFIMFKSSTRYFDSLFISTYTRYKTLAMSLSNNSKHLYFIDDLSLNKIPGNMKQWYLLQTALLQLNMNHCDIIARLRTDIRLLPHIPRVLPANTVYAYSDRVFMSNKNIFFSLFADFYTFARTKYSKNVVTSHDRKVLSEIDMNNKGCVHPCERGRSRKCPKNWHNIPWMWSHMSIFCAETSFSFHIHSRNVSCQPIFGYTKTDTSPLMAGRTKFRFTIPRPPASPLLPSSAPPSLVFSIKN